MLYSIDIEARAQSTECLCLRVKGTASCYQQWHVPGHRAPIPMYLGVF